MPQGPSINDLLKPSAAPAAGNASSASAPSVGSSPKKTPVHSDVDKPSEKLNATIGQIKVQEKERIAQERAAQLGMPYVSLRGFPITPEALVLIPQELATRLQVVAFLRVGEEVRFACVDPTDEIKKVVAQIATDQHAHGDLYLVSEDSFTQAYKLYDKLPKIKEVIYGYRIEEADLAKYEKEIKDLKELQARIGSVNITDVITLIIGAALNADASDVHVEAEEDDVKIRFRMDGVLYDAARLPATSWKQIIGRLKLLAEVKINIEDVPQDGRITIYLAKEKIDIRVSFLPTAYGESVVMRILRPKVVALEFDQLGIRGRALELLKQEIDRPNGMIVTTGPTGSGKTTTLYAILKKLNSPEIKIITLEDPVEYKLAGINQSQIDHNKDYDFAKGLRSILRQDPDVVMVGEIRDLETADIAVQAALTGHLVVSTIHTNSAAGAIPRFLSMGVKNFLLAPALNTIIGQRLVRRLCPDCKKPATLTPAVLKQVTNILSTIPPAAETKVDLNALAFSAPGAGCATCKNMGYKGRLGIYEILVMDKDIEQAMLAVDVSEAQIEKLAYKAGMITMAQDGLLKAMDGLTSVEEVLSVANVDTMIVEPT